MRAGHIDTGPPDPGASKPRSIGAMISERGERSTSELALVEATVGALRAVPAAHSGNTGGAASD